MKNGLLLLHLLLSISIYAQQNNPAISKADLLHRGIVISEADFQNTQPYQLQIIAGYNFDSYRNMNTVRTVKLLAGPMIELASLTDMQRLGYAIRKEIMEHKKDEPTVNVLHPIVTEINIGLSYKPIVRTEKAGNE